MELTESILKVLKDQVLPEIGKLEQGLAGVVKVQEAMLVRLDRMEKEAALRFDLIDRRFEQIDRRFEQIDRRFEQLDKRFEQIDQRLAEHSRRMDLLDKRLEHVETTLSELRRDVNGLDQSIGRLSLLGDYVRKIDELSVELRELRRRQDEFERRVALEVLPRLPKTGTEG